MVWLNNKYFNYVLATGSSGTPTNSSKISKAEKISTTYSTASPSAPVPNITGK